MAYTARQLFALEKELGDQEGEFAEWLRAACELNEDFERSFAEEINEIYSAFRESEQQYDREGAQQITARRPPFCSRKSQMPSSICILTESWNMSRNWHP